MNKKLMLLVAGALTALAFTALPGAASAQETTLKCSADPCNFKVHGGVTSFSLHDGDTVKCTTVTGEGSVALNAETEGTTTTTTLKFHECKEQNTIFHFACNTPGQPSGTAEIGPNFVSHNIKLTKEEAETEAGVIITHPTTTFTCAGGFASTTVTGTVIGELETKCGAPSKGFTQKLNFTAPTDGTQVPRTYTGKTYDLEGKTSHTGGGAYQTAAQSGTATLTFTPEVELTCKA